MKSSDLDRFVRLPTDLLEALLRARLSVAELRIVFWVIRYTFGWNRSSTPFSWYRIAKELRLTRPAVYRAGKRLLDFRVLLLWKGALAIQTDQDAWYRSVWGAVAPRQRSDVSVVPGQRQALPDGNDTVAGEQRTRCPEATLFRPAKHRCKDSLKKEKETRAREPTSAGQGSLPGSTDSLVKVMDFYGAFRETTLQEERTKIFDLELVTAATALLGACGQNADEAIQVIERIGKDLHQEGQPWTLKTICRYCRDSSLMNSCDRENAPSSKLDDGPTIQEEIP